MVRGDLRRRFSSNDTHRSHPDQLGQAWDLGSERDIPSDMATGATRLVDAKGDDPRSIFEDHAMPAVHELMRDIPEEDDGNAERTTEARLQRVHRNLGHPSNILLVQILKGGKGTRERDRGDHKA